MTGIRSCHWWIAVVVALAAHAGLLAAVFWQAPESGAQNAGLGGIEISLGPAGAAPGAEAAAVTEIQEATVTESAVVPASTPVETQVVEAVQPVVEEPATPVETVAVAEPVEPVEPVQETPPVEEPQPVEVAETEMAEAVAEPLVEEVPPTPPEPQAVAEPIVEPVVEPVVETVTPPEAEPVEVAVSEPAAPPAKPVEDAPPEVAEAEPLPSQASAPGAGGRSGTRDAAQSGNAAAATGGGRPGAVADYITTLQLWLEQHKEYPRVARRRRQQGTATLYFAINREGTVLEYQLRASSGYEVLDREVQAMLERAQPLPSMPEDMRQARLELVLPVQFQLR